MKPVPRLRDMRMLSNIRVRQLERASNEFNRRDEEMKIGPFVQATAITAVAVFLMAATSNASTITFNTNAAGTMFAGDGLTLNNSLGAAATLTFTPDGDTTFGVPSNVNFGIFTLGCITCSTQAIGAGSFFDSFTFLLVISDVTDGGSGLFTGSSSGGSVWSDVSQITINWVPLTLGPGAVNAAGGDFGNAIFNIVSPTPIVAPNSGTNVGESTVQGHVDTSAVPEPATLSSVACAMLGLAMLRRKGANGK